jgi:hypothetical protein
LLIFFENGPPRGGPDSGGIRIGRCGMPETFENAAFLRERFVNVGVCPGKNF